MREATLTFELPPSPDAPKRQSVVVIGPDVARTLRPPPSRTLVLGRDADADVRLDAPNVSRRHAALHFTEHGVEIEDLGSKSGTRVGSDRLAKNERRALDESVTAQIGDFILVVQTQEPAPRMLHVWTYETFALRLQEECGARRPFALIRVKTTGASDDAIATALARALPDGAILAAFAPGEHVMLLPSVLAMSTRLEAATHRVAVTSAVSPIARVTTGVAIAPDDATSADGLLAIAAADLGSDTPSTSKSKDAGPVIVDPKMQKLFDLAARVAKSEVTVLLLGETGAGKEVLAERIHRGSTRARGPYVRLNCGAFTETLLESELFGHEKGAFTGAAQTKPGLLETAEGGTILLDEIGELSPSLQVKLLRVLEQREVQRVGALKPRTIDVRFVCATHRDVEAMIADGHFRADLYYRISAFTLVIPPLRERRAEILALAEALAPKARFDEEATKLLEHYAWPGNVRELRNVIERALLLSDGSLICSEHLPDKLRARIAPVAATNAGSGSTDSPAGSLPEEIAELEKRRITEALDRFAGNQTRAAETLGLTRRQLMLRIEALALPRPRPKK